MKPVPLQTSFAAGEVTPRLGGRIDTELLRKALAYDSGWEPLAHGALLSRGGTRKAEQFDEMNGTRTGRLVSFPRQGNTALQLLFGAGKLRVLEDGRPVSSTGVDHLRNPRFAYGSQYWTFSDLTFQGGTVYLPNIGMDWDTGGIWQKVTALPAGDHTLAIEYAAALGNGARIMLSAVGPYLDDLGSFTTAAAVGTATFRRETFAFNQAAPGDVWVTVKEQNNAFAEHVPGVMMGGYEMWVAVAIREVSLRTSGASVAEWDSTTTPALPWGEDQFIDIHVVTDAASDRMMLFHGRVAPHELIHDPESGTWTFAPITFTLPTPAPWGDGAYPATAELYQSRLVVAGIPGKPSTVLASKVGEPYDFTLGSNDGDAWSLALSTKGAASWLRGHRMLLVGTDRGESAMLSQSGRVTPTDFEVRPQSAFGSAPVQAIQVGDLVLYVSVDRRKVRALSYSLQENGWQSREMSWTGEHLTKGLVRELHFAQGSNDAVLAVLHSGEVVAWTFNRAEEVVAPWRVPFGGTVISACVCEGAGPPRVYLLVQRSGTVCLEEWDRSDSPDTVLLDSWVTVLPFDEKVLGLDHLEGMEVVPILDGEVQAPRTVEGGMIYLDHVGTEVKVGLFQRRSAKRFPIVGVPKARIVRTLVQVNDSALPIVNGDRVGYDRGGTTALDVTEPRATGAFQVRALGWDEGAVITIEQDVPIRTEILALYGEIAGGDA